MSDRAIIKWLQHFMNRRINSNTDRSAQRAAAVRTDCVDSAVSQFRAAAVRTDCVDSAVSQFRAAAVRTDCVDSAVSQFRAARKYFGSSVGIATGYGLDGPGIESRWGARFSAPVQTGPGAHPASCTMGTGSFPGVKSGRGVTLTPQQLPVPLVMKE